MNESLVDPGVNKKTNYLAFVKCVFSLDKQDFASL